jgi:uncharacterized protein HemX
MTRKTKLYIAAFAEVCLGSYFLLGFIAWCARLCFSPTNQSSIEIMMAVWAALAIGAFLMYFRTRRKLSQLDKGTDAQSEAAKVQVVGEARNVETVDASLRG